VTNDNDDTLSAHKNKKHVYWNYHYNHKSFWNRWFVDMNFCLRSAHGTYLKCENGKLYQSNKSGIKLPIKMSKTLFVAFYKQHNPMNVCQQFAGLKIL
jgi:hypothetical protein